MEQPLSWNTALSQVVWFTHYVNISFTEGYNMPSQTDSKNTNDLNRYWHRGVEVMDAPNILPQVGILSLNYCDLTHWDQDEMDNISELHFQTYFVE